MQGGGDVEDDVFAAADVDGFALMEERMPVAVGGLELGAGGCEADAFDEEVLDVGIEVGEAPGDVVVVAYDDEGRAGDGDSGDVEGSAGRGGGLEVSLVPDARDAVSEMHIVREERLAGGGVGAGYHPVVGAGHASFAGGFEIERGEGLTQGLEGLRGDGGFGSGEFGLGLVEGDVGEFHVGVGEVGLGLGRRMIAPGAYGVEVGLEFGREVSGDGFMG